MAPPSLPPEEITQLMKFIAEKAKNATSPLNIRELCRLFKEKTGSLVSENCLNTRIWIYRRKIHEMNEFDTETKVTLMLVLNAPINAEFLIELKKVADVEVDDFQRIVHYKQNDGGLELSAKKHMKLSINEGEQRNKSIIQFLAKKSKTMNTPMVDAYFLKEFKAKTGCSDSNASLTARYRRVRNTIFELSGIDKNTKVKMMFISNATISDEVLEELRQDADVEVDEEGGITKYKSNDGSLELEGSHGLSTSMKSVHSHRWQKIDQKFNNVESEEDDNEGSYEKQQIDLIKFLIEKTKNATSPLRFEDLSRNFQKEFKVSGPWTKIHARILSIRQRFHNMNQFDMTTKVKILFALSATIDDDLLKELQKDAIVELDHKQRIAKYEAMDGSLELEGEHSQLAKAKATWANRNKARIVDDSSDSDGDEDKKKNIRKRGRKPDQTATSSSSSVRRSERINNRMSGGKKRRYPYSSSEESEDESSEEEEEDEESMKSEKDAPMDFDTSRVDNSGDEFEYDPPSFHQDNENDTDYDTPLQNKEKTKHMLAEPDSEVSSDEKEEAGPSSSVKIETMSLLDLLNHLRPPTLQYAPSLVPKIDDKINGLANADQQISFNIIGESLEMCIQILNTPDEMGSDENTTSLSDFFYYLGWAMRNITHSTMNDLYTKIENLAWADDTKISMEHIRYAMTETLDKLIR